MSLHTNDWTCPDPSQNMTLAESDRFASELSASLGLEFYDRFARGCSGDIVLEWDLRHNQFLSGRALNLKGHLSAPHAAEINIADFRSRIRAAARSSDPIAQLQAELAGAMPRSDIPAVLLNAPGVRKMLQDGLTRL